jgi:hypothetical protein
VPSVVGFRLIPEGIRPGRDNIGSGSRKGETLPGSVRPPSVGKFWESHTPNQAVFSGRERMGGLPSAVLQSLS